MSTADTPESARNEALSGHHAAFRYFMDTIHALEIELLKMERRALSAELLAEALARQDLDDLMK